MRTPSISRLCAPVLLLAACAGCGSSEPREPAGFVDPFGRRPVAVSLYHGRSVHLDYRVRELSRLSDVERQREARVIAQAALQEFGSRVGPDTVVVSFSQGDTTRILGLPGLILRSRTQTQAFTFPRRQLEGAR